ncbi:hypothetical protein EV121DRAFT_275778 [Schizophyllum commune]
MSTNDNQVYWPLGSDVLRQVKVIATRVAVDFVLYGVQVTLSVAAIAILARRHGRSRFTLVAICGLLSSSTIYTVTDTAYCLVQFPIVIGTSERAIEAILYRLDILSGVSKNLNFVLSDVVLIWRAWCLWPKSRIVKSILSLCGCGSVVGAIAEQAWVYWPSLYNLSTVESNGQTLVRLVPLLITNIVATVLIGTKVLHYRREVKGSLGIAYILFWIADCTMAFVAYQDGFSGGAIFNNISHNIAGIYPTCVLFAAAGGTTDSLLSAQVSQAMRFAGSPVAHEGAREADTTIDFHLQDEDENSVSALNDGPQDLDSRVDNLAGASGIHDGQSRVASSEGIIEVERETIAT